MRAAVLVLLAAIPAFADTSAPARHRAQHRGRHIIAAADQCFVEPATRYKATKPQVARLEAGLRRALEDARATQRLARFNEDSRWYIGFTDGTRHRILVEGVCAEDELSRAPCPGFVDDGGDCFWSLNFDVEAGTFSGLYINSSI